MPPQAQTRAKPGAAPAGARNGMIALGCVMAGIGFAGLLWLRRGPEPAQQYLAGYLIELSLSVDNVFVFALVFEQFGVEPSRRGRLLFWGVAGAILMRSAFLIAGIAAIQRFAWVIPVLGAFILLTGIRLAASRGKRTHGVAENPAIRLVVRHVPHALAALVALELADLVFALDSLPAVLAVTHNVLIAMASNLFAILGLRSLFFVVSGALRELRFLKAGLAAILGFVGAKMLAEPWYPVPTAASLAAIAGILALSVGASLLARRKARQ
jgi:tellurite resistance protein TerC